MAREDQFVFLAVHAYRTDGTYMHVEIASVAPEEDLPPESA